MMARLKAAREAPKSKIQIPKKLQFSIFKLQNEGEGPGCGECDCAGRQADWGGDHGELKRS
jgi:hypothetical protein